MTLQRLIASLLIASMLLPTIVGCAAPPTPATVQLAGIVVDETHVASADEVGLVRVWRRGSPISAHVGMTLAVGDRIETPGNAEAVIRWPSGSEIFMRPNSAGTIGSFTAMVGEVFARIKGVFAVETTFVTAAARGTAYLVRTARDGATTVIVVEGEVIVDSPTAAWRSVRMGPGTQAQAHPQAPVPVPASVDELRRTQAWVGRLEKQVPAPKGGLSKTGAAALAIGAIIGVILGSQRDEPQRTHTSPNRYNDPSQQPRK